MDKRVIQSVLRHMVGAVGVGLTTYYGVSPDVANGAVDAAMQLLGVILAGSAALGGVADKRVNPPAEKVAINEPVVVGKGYSLGTRSLANLKGVHPDLAEVISTAIITSPYDFTVTEGVRSAARQRELYNARPRVTKTLNSKHLLQADGTGHAVDLYVFDPSQPNGADERVATYRRLNDHIQEVARRLGISVTWGGDFQGFFDGHHWEIG